MSDNKSVALFCSDLDGTLIGKPEASLDFRHTWESLGEDRPILVYSTGRLIDDAKKVIREAGLPDPDYYIGGVGTMMHDEKSGSAVSEFSSMLSEGWSREKAVEVAKKFPDITEQPEEQQHEWKSSWFWHDASDEDLEKLRAALNEAGAGAQIVYSSAKDLDILPTQANKGNALRWICSQLQVELNQVIVAGDTGNDSSMFLVSHVRGIAPVNAEPELREAVGNATAYFANEECAAGILEGLIHYGLIERIITK